MVWRAAHEEDKAEAAPGIDALVNELCRGSAAAEARLISCYVNGSTESSDAVLNRLAVAAAEGSPYALELLLGLVTDYRLTAAAIARHVRDAVLAEEVEQEVLIAVARSIHRYRGDAKFTTWLWSLARNTAISELRRQRSNSSVDDEAGDRNQRRLSSLVAERDMVREAVYSLPPVFRETVLLRDVERLSYSEIAERQGLAINTVRSRLSRGRALLAARIPTEPTD